MKRYLMLLCVLGFMLHAVPVWAGTEPVLIDAVQTESLTSADEEYILLVNNSVNSINISGWHAQYFSASAANFTAPSRNVALSGLIAAHGTLLIAAGSPSANATFSAGMSVTGGHVRLVSGSGASEIQHDLLGWGTAAHPETTSVPQAAKGQVYSRKKSADGLYVDTNNNQADFTNGVVATFQPTETGQVNPPATSAAIQITELLPNPASPATDANDEFVELFNPTSDTVLLTGYKLQTGTSYSYSYLFTSGSLAAGEYKAFYSTQTKLTLSNTSGKTRLLSNAGMVVSETAPYEKATSGTSWSFNGDTWVWSATPTPGAENNFVVPAVAGASTIALPSKTTSSPSASKPKATGTSTKKPSATKAAKTTVTTDKKAYQNPASNNQPLPINPFILVGVGVTALGYMIYEYRDALANRFARFKRNRIRRRPARG